MIPVTPVYRYRASVVKVIDGDTYIMKIDVGFRAALTLNLRVRGYDSPEIVGADKVRGLAARDAASDLLARAKVIVVESYKDARSFERWVADVYVDGVSIAEMLTAAGHVAVLTPEEG